MHEDRAGEAAVDMFIALVYEGLANMSSVIV